MFTTLLTFATDVLQFKVVPEAVVKVIPCRLDVPLLLRLPVAKDPVVVAPLTPNAPLMLVEPPTSSVVVGVALAIPMNEPTCVIAVYDPPPPPVDKGAPLT